LGLPEDLRNALKGARKKRFWSQTELGERAGTSQNHVSDIENGRVVPRFDTLQELVRVLDLDLVLVPRQLVPTVLALIRDHAAAERGPGERSLYADDDPGDPDRADAAHGGRLD
jgi:transcriptional regulator with XRE-family HTH domain